ncbi:MAG: hypothetical protein HY078_05690 [Elusimicrobia bacterium]|nr:hypothetical protein [Elusimicrobiota bacterium]
MILLHRSSGRRPLAAISARDRAKGRAPSARPAGKTWAYLGQEPRDLLRWQRELGPGWTRLDVSAEVAAAAEAMRRPYVEWIDAMSAAHGGDIAWWTSSISEKNAYSSPLFYETCAAHALVRLARAKRLPDALVCESWGLRTVAAGILRSTSIPFEAPGGWRSAAACAGERAKLAARSLQFLVRAAKGLLLGRAPRLSAGTKPRAVIATYVHAASLSADGGFKDRYFPGLAETLERAGFEVWNLPKTLLPQISIREQLRRMRAGNSRFLIRQDWLRLSDYAAALSGSWRALRLPEGPPPLSAEFDAAPLVAEERLRQARSLESMEARLSYRLTRRLAEGGFKPALAVTWFENQKDDKALSLGLREAFPGLDQAGYFSFLPSPNYLTPFPTPAERRAGVVADRIICCGRYQASILGRDGGTARTSVGAALRYDYLWKDGRARASAGTTFPPTALAPLPSRLSESAELLDILLRTIPLAPGIKRWRVKPHPDYKIGQLLDYLGLEGWPKEIQIVSSSVDELLAESTVVLSGGSGTLIEAASAGVPIVILGRLTGLDFNTLAWFPEFGAPETDPAAVARRIERAAALAPEERARLRERGRALLKECYEPVTEESLRAFFGDPSKNRTMSPIGGQSA